MIRSFTKKLDFFHLDEAAKRLLYSVPVFTDRMKGAEHEPKHASSFKRKDYQPEVTASDLTATIDTSLALLLSELQTGKTERLLSYLTFSSRFHHYSPRNQQLIFNQRPDATHVASFATWKKEGYHVAKGEKGIRILIPRFPKRTSQEREDEEDTGNKDQDEKKRKINEGQFVAHQFTVGSVFDVSQLRPEDQKRVPTFFTQIAGDYQATYARMREAAQQDGITVVETFQQLEGAQAASAGGTILIRPDLPPGNKAYLLAHEWGHEKIHTPDLRRKLSKTTKEGHAEAVAYVVATHFDIPTPDSAEYLTMWDNTPDSLKRELAVVSAASSHIIQKIHSLNPGEARFHDPTAPIQ